MDRIIPRWLLASWSASDDPPKVDTRAGGKNTHTAQAALVFLHLQFLFVSQQYCSGIANLDWFRTHPLREISNVQSGVYSDSNHPSQFPGCARRKALFLTALPNLKIISLDAGLRMEGMPPLSCRKHFSHCDAKKNLQHPSGKRHYISHSVDHLTFDMVDHVRPTFQRAPSQPGSSFKKIARRSFA